MLKSVKSIETRPIAELLQTFYLSLLRNVVHVTPDASKRSKLRLICYVRNCDNTACIEVCMNIGGYDRCLRASFMLNVSCAILLPQLATGPCSLEDHFKPCAWRISSQATLDLAQITPYSTHVLMRSLRPHTDTVDQSAGLIARQHLQQASETGLLSKLIPCMHAVSTWAITEGNRCLY
jgi:hypothetical protein